MSMSFGALGRGVSSIGLNRRILLDLSTTFVFMTGSMGGSGARNFTFPVPNQSSLRDRSLYLQGFDFTANDQHLTNSVDAYIK